MNFSKILHTLGIGRSSVKPIEDKASILSSPSSSSKNDLTHAVLVIVENFSLKSVHEIAWRPRHSLVLASPNAAAHSLILISLIF